MNKRRLYDTAFGIHGCMVGAFLLFWTGDQMTRIFPQLNETLLSVGETALYLFLSIFLVAVPSALVISLLYWKDWKLLVPGICLLVLSLVILSADPSQACILPQFYTH